jgi:hypothetical protein
VGETHLAKLAHNVGWVKPTLRNPPCAFFLPQNLAKAQGNEIAVASYNGFGALHPPDIRVIGGVLVGFAALHPPDIWFMGL